MPASDPPSAAPDTERDSGRPTRPGDADARPTIRPSQRPTPIDPTPTPGSYRGKPTEERVVVSPRKPR